jgi:hypothetical protein
VVFGSHSNGIESHARAFNPQFVKLKIRELRLRFAIHHDNYAHQSMIESAPPIPKCRHVGIPFDVCPPGMMVASDVSWPSG